MMKKKILIAGIFLFVSICYTQLFAQVTIGALSEPDPNAVLDLKSNNKGLLLPRVYLTGGTTGFAPLSTHVRGMTVYNLENSRDVTPGYYYNDGEKWVRIMDSVSVSSMAWLLNGNTNGGSKTLGTQDSYDLPIITANTEKMRITTGGNVGIGTATPAARLDIENATAGAIKIADGTQVAGYALTSDANGVGTWKTPALKMVIGVKGNGVDIPWQYCPSFDCPFNLDTGTKITLPHGKWMVYIQMLIGPNSGQLLSTDAIWLRTTFSDSRTTLTMSNDIDITTAGTYYVSGEYMGTSDGKAGGVGFSLMQGYIVITNSGSSDKTYYYYVYNGGATRAISGTVISKFGASSWGENVMIATPVQ